MGFVTKTKNRYRVVVEVLVEADSMESAQEEALRQFNASRDNVSVVEVREEETLGADYRSFAILMMTNSSRLLQWSLNSPEEAKHLYNLMRVIFNNLQKDPDYTPLMPEARTIAR